VTDQELANAIVQACEQMNRAIEQAYSAGLEVYVAVDYFSRSSTVRRPIPAARVRVTRIQRLT
jgi:hypothetical protein